MLIDLHVHLPCDKGESQALAELVDMAVESGLDALAIVQPDNAWGMVDVQKCTTRYPLFVGVEITTESGDMLCFPSDPNSAQYRNKKWRHVGGGLPQAEDVVSLFRKERGAVVALPKKNRGEEAPETWRALCRLLTTPGLSGVEISGMERTDPLLSRVLHLANRLGLACVGGSAGIGHSQPMGSVASLFRHQVYDQQHFASHIRRGCVWPVRLGGE